MAYPPKGSDWFSNLFFFREGDYALTKSLLELQQEGSYNYLVSNATDTPRKYCVGNFSTPTLGQLREKCKDIQLPGKLRLSNVLGDVAEKHAKIENRHATFQVASQFNCLEFVSPSCKPEDGITGYASDRTQGPACSIACGPATAYRNYFAQVDGGPEEGGQTRDNMLDNLRDVDKVLGNSPGSSSMYSMQGGYSMAHDNQLGRLNAKLDELKSDGIEDSVREALRIGLHEDVQVTATRWGASLVEDPEQQVTQVFGSACAVAYNPSRPENWRQFATIVLEASYEATFWSAVLAAERHKAYPHGSNIIYLTALGGGVFGNSMTWIGQAIKRSCEMFADYDLDIRVVTYGGAIPSELAQLERDFGAP